MFTARRTTADCTDTDRSAGDRGTHENYHNWCPVNRSFDTTSACGHSDFINAEERQSQIAVSKSKSLELMKMERE